MKLFLRLESVTPEHIRQSMFVNGRWVGDLTLKHGEYQELGVALLLGAKHMMGILEVEIDPIGWDEEGNFAMPNRRQK